MRKLLCIAVVSGYRTKITVVTNYRATITVVAGYRTKYSLVVNYRPPITVQYPGGCFYRGKRHRDEKSLPRRALEIFIFPVQLTTSRIGNLIRLIITLAILFAGFVARMKDTRLPNYVMFGELVGGAGCWGGRKKSGWGVS